MKIIRAVAVACLIPSSGALAQLPISAAPEDSVVEATSLLGEKLLRPVPTGDARTTMLARFAEATRGFKSAPADADSIIWLGRRTAYLGRFNEAIDIYTRGIALHPNDSRMLRHRGHRYLTTRQLDKALADFEKAYELTKPKPDAVEPDGLPNARNIPTSTLKSNIRYHLGLTHYLKGDFEKAARFYTEDIAAAANPDMHVASAHWLYMSLRRMGKTKDAEQVLAPITSKMDVIENTAYHRLLLMYKGEIKPTDVLPEQNTPSLENVTTAYGVANWHLYNGRDDEAHRLFEHIAATRAQWPSFGYLAAEAELARDRARPRR